MFSDSWGDRTQPHGGFSCHSNHSIPACGQKTSWERQKKEKPPVKQTDSISIPELEWTLSVIQPCLRLYKFLWHFHPTELRKTGLFNLLLSEQNPCKFPVPAWALAPQGGYVCTMAELWTRLQFIPVATEASPWVIFKSLVTSWMWCSHLVCSSHFPSPCCPTKGLRLRTIYFQIELGKVDHFELFLSKS